MCRLHDVAIKITVCIISFAHSLSLCGFVQNKNGLHLISSTAQNIIANDYMLLCMWYAPWCLDVSQLYKLYIYRVYIRYIYRDKCFELVGGIHVMYIIIRVKIFLTCFARTESKWISDNLYMCVI